MTDIDSSSPSPSQSQSLSDSLLSLHLVLIWLLTLVFCWKVFPAIFTSSSTANNVSSLNTSQARSPSPSTRSEQTKRNSCLPSLTTSPLPIPSAEGPRKSVKDTNKKLVSQLQLEACAKAKEAGKHPSYVTLVLNLVHHYNLDINQPVLANSFTIFHCSCLSGSLELVSSLSPMADIHHLTDHGDSPLYLAVYAAAHKAGKRGGNDVEGLEVVQHLLQAGSQVNQTNLAGFTALHQASRLSCPELVRLLLDWGANQQVGTMDRTGGSIRNMSIMTRASSVMTRSMTNKVEGLNKSFLAKHTVKQKK